MRKFFDALSPPARIIRGVVMLPLLLVLIVWKLKHLWEHFVGIVVIGYAAAWYLITDPSTYAGDYASDVRLYLGVCAFLIGLSAVVNWRNHRPNLRQLSVALALGAFLLFVSAPELLGFRIIVAGALAWVLEKAAIALATEIWGLPKDLLGSEKAGV